MILSKPFQILACSFYYISTFIDFSVGHRPVKQTEIQQVRSVSGQWKMIYGTVQMGYGDSGHTTEQLCTLH